MGVLFLMFSHGSETTEVLSDIKDGDSTNFDLSDNARSFCSFAMLSIRNVLEVLSNSMHAHWPRFQFDRTSILEFINWEVQLLNYFLLGPVYLIACI